MKNRIDELKARYAKAKTKTEFEAIEKEMESLSTLDNDAFSDAMVSLAKDSVEDCRELLLKDQLKEVLPIVSIAYIAKAYFNKTRSWLYQRINGSIVNGKPAKFTPEELETLKRALLDISEKINTSVSVVF
ncbi:MAG: DUF5053 domain-containing protein [Rikenellaceae bacterium]